MTGQLKVVVLVIRPDVSFVEVDQALKALEPWLMVTPKVDSFTVTPGCDFSIDVSPITLTVA